MGAEHGLGLPDTRGGAGAVKQRMRFNQSMMEDALDFAVRYVSIKTAQLYDVEDLLDYTRDDDASDVRCLLARFLTDNGVTQVRVGELMGGRHHTTVRYMLKVRGTDAEEQAQFNEQAREYIQERMAKRAQEIRESLS